MLGLGEAVRLLHSVSFGVGGVGYVGGVGGGGGDVAGKLGV